MVVDTSHLNCSDLDQLNLTDVARASTYLISPGARTLALAVQLTAFAIGVPGNLSFLVSVARVPYMRTITNYFLVSLSIADLTFLLFTVTSYLLYLTAPVRSHIHSLVNLSCPVSFSIPFLTYFASVGTIWLVSAERYSAICRPLKHIAAHTKKRAVKLILATWAVSCGLSALAVLQYVSPDKFCVTWPDSDDDKFSGLPDIIGFCLPLAPWAIVVGNLTASLPFLVALISNMIMYIQIIRTLSTRPVTTPNSSPEDGKQGMSAKARVVRNQVARMLIINGSVFFFCQLPYAVINLIYVGSYVRGLTFLQINELQNSLRIFSHSLLFINSAINPIIYYAICPSYRRAVRIALTSNTHSTEVS
ncbi:orexin receptor type 2-like [Asterias rubens]|uniref:orexin receptor type 2-like n=1 Tax=Asterias rubens TaxID=7604 RepID=UPI001455D053|nr:orexin receptor type 2-like [Asterias rubens]